MGLVTRRQLEAMNPRAPVEVAVCRLKLRSKDHRAAVNRVDADRTVIAPTGQVSSLRSASDQNRRFVAQRSQRIGWSAKRITNTRHNTSARDVVTDSDAASFVHRSTSHPAKIAGWREGALLVHDWIRASKTLTGRIAQLIPANSYARAASH